MTKKPARPKPIEAGSERVYQGLRRVIIEQTLAVGARLPEDTVATRFGVGRTIAREAIARLTAEGLVERQSNRGARVALLAPAEADDIVAVRRELEAIVMRRLTGAVSKKDLARLRAHVRLQNASFRDRPTAIRLSAEFHVLLAEITGSPTLRRFVADIVARSSLIFLAQATTHALHCGPKEHEAIIDAIERGDAKEAETQMLKHLTEVDDRSRYRPGPAKDFTDLPPNAFKRTT